MVGDHVRLQDPKSLRWSVTGVVTKAISHQGADRPTSYEVTADEGGVFLRNGRYLRLREKQSDSENADSDSNEEETTPVSNNEASNSSEDPRDLGKQAEPEYKQNSEEKETVYRRSPRLKKQCRVSYEEDHISIAKNVQSSTTTKSSRTSSTDFRSR